MQVPAVSATMVPGPGTTNAVAPAPVAVQLPAPAVKAVADQAELEKAFRAASDALREISTDLDFSLDPSTGKTVVRVIDNGTGQVIRQFPSEEMLAIARAIDRFKGFLLREEA